MTFSPNKILFVLAGGQVYFVAKRSLNLFPGASMKNFMDFLLSLFSEKSLPNLPPPRCNPSIPTCLNRRPLSSAKC